VQLPPAVPVVHGFWNGSPASAVHNRFPVLWQQLNADAVAEAGRTGDVVFFCRSAYVGSGGR
jgi:alpha-glucosidase